MQFLDSIKIDKGIYEWTENWELALIHTAAFGRTQDMKHITNAHVLF